MTRDHITIHHDVVARAYRALRHSSDDSFPHVSRRLRPSAQVRGLGSLASLLRATFEDHLQHVLWSDGPSSHEREVCVELPSNANRVTRWCFRVRHVRPEGVRTPIDVFEYRTRFKREVDMAVRDTGDGRMEIADPASQSPYQVPVEVQIYPLEAYLDTLSGEGLVNHRAYKRRQFLSELLPILFPREIYGSVTPAG